jgi:hypothetical protein
MAIYQEDRGGQNVDVFLREETIGPGGEPDPDPEPSRGGGSLMLVLNVGLVLLVLGGVVGGLWYVYQPQVNLSTPVQESLPFQQSAAYVTSYDQVREITGPEPTVRDAGETFLDWSLDGSGFARVHLAVEGPRGATEAFLEWHRERDAWLVKSASFLLPDGQRQAIPLGAGTFLSTHDLAAWRAADGGTALGRGQRELIQGRPFQAIQLFNEALELDPENTTALLWRGRAFESVGNYQKALADYQRILSFDAEHSAALVRLDALRASPPPGAPTADPPKREPTVQRPPSPTALIPE